MAVHGKAVKTSELRIEHKRLLRKQNYQQRQVGYDELNIIINADLNAPPRGGGGISKVDTLGRLAPVTIGCNSSKMKSICHSVRMDIIVKGKLTI